MKRLCEPASPAPPGAFFCGPRAETHGRGGTARRAPADTTNAEQRARHPGTR